MRKCERREREGSEQKQRVVSSRKQTQVRHQSQALGLGAGGSGECHGGKYSFLGKKKNPRLEQDYCFFPWKASV